MPVASGTQYAVRTDLANLGLIGGVLASILPAVQDAALAAAASVADSYLQGRYVLPLSSWGQDLVAAVCAIAAYNLMASKGYNPAAGADPNIRQRYLDAIEWLRGVAKETETPASIVDASTLAPDSGDSTSTQTHGGLQLTTSNVRGWTGRGGNSVVDPGRSDW